MSRSIIRTNLKSDLPDWPNGYPEENAYFESIGFSPVDLTRERWARQTNDGNMRIERRNDNSWKFTWLAYTTSERTIRRLEAEASTRTAFEVLIGHLMSGGNPR